MSDSDDDVPQLHPDTLAALNEFHREKEEREKQFQAALEQNENEDAAFAEDWVQFLI